MLRRPRLPPPADAAQVRGAFANLVRNAVEAMPHGGVLTFTAWREDAKVKVAVADTGPGIPPEVQRRLFEPLITTKPLGLGLGLTTARTLVENQGGALTFHGKPGEGARFEVSLRVAAASATSTPRAPP